MCMFFPSQEENMTTVITVTNKCTELQVQLEREVVYSQNFWLSCAEYGTGYTNVIDHFKVDIFYKTSWFDIISQKNKTSNCCSYMR